MTCRIRTTGPTVSLARGQWSAGLAAGGPPMPCLDEGLGRSRSKAKYNPCRSKGSDVRIWFLSGSLT